MKTLQKQQAKAFAPSNIALIKYWGKRDEQLNLPVTNSLSISLGDKGTSTRLRVSEDKQDHVFLNGQAMAADSSFAQRIVSFLDLFRQPEHRFIIETENNIPTAAGLASSASGFAALSLALNDIYGWQLDKPALSRMARRGSGSACRSVYEGFVEWQKGEKADGSDSFAEPLNINWPEFKIGLLLLTTETKSISSRQAMRNTVKTSPAYQQWPQQVAEDLAILKQGLQNKDFTLVGQTAERNAIAMHETMHQAQPPIDYDLAESKSIKQRVQQARQEGLSVYFTQDAGPNIKLLFLQTDEQKIKKYFPSLIS